MSEDERIKASLADILEYVKGVTEKGGEFVGEQAPLVCQEIVTFGRVYHSALVMVCICAFALTIPAWRWIIRWTKANRDEPEVPMCVIFSLAPGTLNLITLIGFCGECRSCILAWVAPRLYIMEYISDLLK